MSSNADEQILSEGNASVVKSAAVRKAEAAHRFADRLAAYSPGVTPRWKQAVETHRRLKAIKVTRS